MLTGSRFGDTLLAAKDAPCALLTAIIRRSGHYLSNLLELCSPTEAGKCRIAGFFLLIGAKFMSESRDWQGLVNLSTGRECAMVTIAGKSLGRKKPLFADFSISFPPDLHEGGDRLTLRDLIVRVVRAEVEAFRTRQAELRTDELSWPVLP
jgi:hypothetical protein